MTSSSWEVSKYTLVYLDVIVILGNENMANSIIFEQTFNCFARKSV